MATVSDDRGALACAGCEAAIELDQVATILFENAELAVIACDTHLRRIVLAIEVLEALEEAGAFEIPALVNVAFHKRLLVEPERRS